MQKLMVSPGEAEMAKSKRKAVRPGRNLVSGWTMWSMCEIEDGAENLCGLATTPFNEK